MPSVVASTLTRLDDVVTLVDDRLAFPADDPDGYTNAPECYVNGVEANLSGEVAIKGTVNPEEGVSLGQLNGDWRPAFNSPAVVTQRDADDGRSYSFLLFDHAGGVQFVPSERLAGTPEDPLYIEVNVSYLLASAVA